MPAAHRHVDELTGTVSLRLRNGALLTYRPSRAERHTLAVTLLARGGNGAETDQGLLPTPAPSRAPAPAPRSGVDADSASVSEHRAGVRYAPPASGSMPLAPGITDVALRAFLASGAGGHSAATLERLCTLWGVAFSSAAAAETIAITMTAVSAGTAIADAAAAAATTGCATGAASPGGSSDSGPVLLVPTAGSELVSVSGSVSGSISGSVSGSGESGVALWHMLLLLHLFLFSCDWDEAAVARVRADKASELADAATSLEQMADLALLNDAFGPGDGRALWPTAAAVRRMRRDGMQAALASQLLPAGNIQLIVTGDVDWRHVEAQVARFLGPLLPVPTPLATSTLASATVPPLEAAAAVAADASVELPATSLALHGICGQRPVFPDAAAEAVVSASLVQPATTSAATSKVTATFGGSGSGAGPGSGMFNGELLVSALSSCMGMAHCSFVTPSKGDTVTLLSPQHHDDSAADHDAASELGSGGCDDTGSAALRNGNSKAAPSDEAQRRAKGKGKGKGKSGAGAAAAALSSLQLQRQAITLPADSRMALHGPLAKSLDTLLAALPIRLVASNIGVGVGAGSETGPARPVSPHPDTAWFTPLRDASGATRWYSPFSGSLATMMEAARHNRGNDRMYRYAPSPGSKAGADGIVAAEPGAGAGAESSGDSRSSLPAPAPRLSAPLPLIRSPAPLPPTLLSGRVVTLPEEKEARCQISMALPCRGKYTQGLVAAALATVDKLLLAAAGGGESRPQGSASVSEAHLGDTELASASLPRVSADLELAAKTAHAALALLSPGYDSALPPVLPSVAVEATFGLSAEPPHAILEAGSDAGPAPAGTNARVRMRVNRRHPLFLYRSANVWNDVISNRLYRVLRDESGSCYAASFSLSASEFADAGFGHATATPLPSHTARVLASAVRVIVSTLSGAWPLSEQEVEEARAPIATEVATSLHSSSYWSALLKHAHGFHGSQRSLAVALTGMRCFYECVTLEDIEAALACEWAAAPRPLPIHVTVGIAAGASAAAEARARGEKLSKGAQAKAKPKAKAKAKAKTSAGGGGGGGDSGAGSGLGSFASAKSDGVDGDDTDVDDLGDVYTEAALRRELGLRRPAAVKRASESGSTGVAGKGVDRWDAIWQDLVAEASRCYYSGVA